MAPDEVLMQRHGVGAISDDAADVAQRLINELAIHHVDQGIVAPGLQVLADEDVQPALRRK
jgi:hypothetical protein